MVKNLLVNVRDIGDAVQSLGWEDPPEKEMAPMPVFLPERFHGQEEFTGSQRVGHSWSNLALTREELKGTMTPGLGNQEKEAKEGLSDNNKVIRKVCLECLFRMILAYIQLILNSKLTKTAY